ncbi:MAG: ABC transporter substrate-binding protein [Alphaproteobacteria bacterium]
MRRTRPFHTFAAGLLSASFLAAPALAEGLKLGALIPLSGGLATYGESSLNGMRLAVDQANAADGVLGGEVELVVGDTQTRSQPAVDAANRLVGVEGVSGILGAMSSGNTVPVATSVSAVEGIPQISNASTAPTITDLDDNDFLFRTVPSDAQQGLVLGDLVEAEEIERVAVLYVNNDYGQGLAESFEASFTEAGGTVTQSAAFEPNKASYRGELSNVAGDGAEALLLIAYPDDGGLLILRQSLEEGFFERFIFTDGMKASQVATDFGEFIDGAFGTAPKAPESAEAEAFASAYEEAYGEMPPLPFIDSAYDAAMILMLAAEAAGSAEGEAIRDAIRDVTNAPGEVVGPGEFARAKELLADGEDIDYEGAAGSHEFDENGDVSGAYEHWVITDGELETVEIIN